MNKKTDINYDYGDLKIFDEELNGNKIIIQNEPYGWAIEYADIKYFPPEDKVPGRLFRFMSKHLLGVSWTYVEKDIPDTP